RLQSKSLSHGQTQALKLKWQSLVQVSAPVQSSLPPTCELQSSPPRSLPSQSSSPSTTPLPQVADPLDTGVGLPAGVALACGVGVGPLDGEGTESTAGMRCPEANVPCD